MAKKIYFPPSVHAAPLPPCCLTFGEELTLEFAASGYLSVTDNTAFNPDLPTGSLQFTTPPLNLGPYTADSEIHTFTISYMIDTVIYSQDIHIRKTCPPEKPRPKPRK